MMSRTTRLTHDRLLEVLAYDRESGVFTWLMTLSGRGKAGAEAGSIQPGTGKGQGYVRISIDGERFAAHRLAWFYVLGVWPTLEIDHRNSVRHDNRWDNLREATPGQNKQNRGLLPSNRSGFKGVHYNEPDGCWVASIDAEGRKHVLGRFHDAQQAHAAYVEAARRLHGEFAKVH